MKKKTSKKKIKNSCDAKAFLRLEKEFNRFIKACGKKQSSVKTKG